MRADRLMANLWFMLGSSKFIGKTFTHCKNWCNQIQKQTMCHESDRIGTISNRFQNGWLQNVVSGRALNFHSLQWYVCIYPYDLLFMPSVTVAGRMDVYINHYKPAIMPESNCAALNFPVAGCVQPNTSMQINQIEFQSAQCFTHSYIT